MDATILTSEQQSCVSFRNATSQMLAKCTCRVLSVLASASLALAKIRDDVETPNQALELPARAMRSALAPVQVVRRASAHRSVRRTFVQIP